MSRLPIVGGDPGNWGAILNDFLSVEHNPDGTQKTLDVDQGGTGATTATAARTNLGAISSSDAQAQVDSHVNDTTDAHDASAISFSPTGTVAATDVQAAIAEVAAEAAGVGNAFVQNGNSFGGLATLGTNDNQALALETNNTERVRIDTSGNVGIGTTSAGSTVDVAKAGDDATLYLHPLSAGGYDGLLTIERGTDTTSRAYLKFRNSAAAGSQFWNIGMLNTATSNNSLSFSSTGNFTNNAQVLITSGGNVGIGTTTPGTNNRLIVNAYSTVDNAATAQVNTNNAANKGLVVQGTASQTANLLELQTSTGAKLAEVTPAGAVNVGTYTGTPQASKGNFFSSGDQLGVWNTTDMAIDLGGSIALGGVDTTGGDPTRSFAKLGGKKENGTSTDRRGYMAVYTRTSSTLPEAIRWTSNQSTIIGPAVSTTELAQGGLTVYGAPSQKSAVIRANATTPGNVVELQDSTGISLWQTDAKGRVMASTTTQRSIDPTAMFAIGSATAGKVANPDTGGGATYAVAVNVQNTVTTSSLAAYYAKVSAGTSTTITDGYGIYVDPSSNGGGGAVTNYYGATVKALNGNNNYGVAIEAQSTQTLWLSSNANNTTAAAGMAFGSSRDTNLYRSAADTLKTDDAFVSAANASIFAAGAAPQTEIGGVGPGGESGLRLGSAADTNLYRSAANTLKTDDNLFSAADIRSNVGSELINLSISSSKATIFFGASQDVNLYRDAANTLKTDDTLIVGAAGTAAGSAATIDGTQTLTNKRVTKRIETLTDAATVTPNSDANDGGKLTTLSQTTNIANPTGTPTSFQQYILRIKSSSSRSLTWGSQFRGGTDIALPSATSGGSLTDYYGFQWNSDDSKWDIIAIARGY